MKYSTLFRVLLLGAFLFSPTWSNAAVSAEAANAAAVGLQLDSSNADVYALNMALSSTTSSVVDLRTKAGFLISVTGTSTGAVSVEWNNISYSASTWYAGVPVTIRSHQYLQKQAKWARFKPSSLLGPTQKTTLWYSLIDSAGGTATAPMSITSTDAFTTITSVAGTWAVDAVTTYNLTSSAGSSVPLEAWLSASQGGTGIRWIAHPSAATAPTLGWLQAFGNYAVTTSTAQITGRHAAGTHISVIGLDATVTGNLTLVR